MSTGAWWWCLESGRGEPEASELGEFSASVYWALALGLVAAMAYNPVVDLVMALSGGVAVGDDTAEDSSDGVVAAFYDGVSIAVSLGHGHWRPWAWEGQDVGFAVCVGFVSICPGLGDA